MDSIVIKAADLLFTAVRSTNTQMGSEAEQTNSRALVVTCTDLMTGKVHSAIMTDNEVESVVGCLLSKSGEGTPAQYKRALVAVEGFPNECRPIP